VVRYDIIALVLVDVFAIHCVLKTKKNYFLNVLLLPGVELFLLSSGACTTVVNAKDAW
jgi:hypothetical protein